MQDKDAINEEFTDFAWGEMNKVLDREMPVKKKKKRFVFWLFLGLGFALSIALAYLGLTSEPSKDKALSPVVAEQMEVMSSSTTDALGNTDQSIDNKQVEATNNKLEEPTAQNNFIEKVPKTSISKNRGTNEDITAKTVIKKQIINPTVTPNEIIIESEIKENANYAITPAPKTVEDKPTMRSLLMPIDVLETLMVQEESLAYAEIAAIDLNKKDASEKNFWQKLNPAGFQVYAGGQSHNFEVPLGMQAGFKLDYGLGSRFGLNIGLEYQMLRKKYPLIVASSSENSISVSSAELESLFVNEPQDPINVPSPLDTEDREYFIEITTFNFLNLPIDLYYKLSPKWRLNVGLQASYLMNAKGTYLGYRVGNETEQFSVPRSNLNLNRSAENDRDYVQSLLDTLFKNDSPFSKWSWSASIGGSYFLSDKIGLHAKYNFGFPNIIKNENFGEGFRNSTIQLSLSYQLFD